MIILKYLRANNFKSLRSVQLHFPERGSVLIEGQNEAGKSTLFEAVYVALYGKPLVGEETVARQDEVIQHGQTSALVQLAFNVGQQALTVTRHFERGKTQQATLKIQRPGTPEEVIQRARAVNDRVLKELGNLDGDSLRNSCFVEQKELGRIEDLVPADRERAVQKLLGLDRLTRMMDELKFKREQRVELELAELRLQLAQLQAEGEAAAARETELAERLDAVKIAGHVWRLGGLAVHQAELEAALDACALRVQHARDRLTRCEELKQQIESCDQASQRLMAIDHARGELRRSGEELARLERIELVELPAARAYMSDVSIAAEAVAQTLQARLLVQQAKTAQSEAQRQLVELEQAEEEQQRKERALSNAQARLTQRHADADAERQRLTQQLGALEEKRALLEQALTLVRQWEITCEQRDTIQKEIAAAEDRRRELLRLQAAVQQREREVQNAETAASRAEQETQQTMNTVRLATAHEALTAWVRLKRVEMAVSGYAMNQGMLFARREEAEAALTAAHNRTRLPFYAGISLTMLALLAFILGVLWLPALVIFAFLLGGPIAAWLWFIRTRKSVQECSAALDQCERELQSLDMQRQAAIQTGGDPATLRYYEQHLQASGFAIPPDVEAGGYLQEKLRQQLGTLPVHHALQEAAQRAQGNLSRLTEQLRQARIIAEESRKALSLAQQTGDPATEIDALQVRLAERERSVTTAAQQAQQFWMSGQWPTTSYAVQEALATCQADLRAVKVAQEQHESTAASLIQESEADQTKAEEAVRRAQDLVSTRGASDPAAEVSRAQEALSKTEEVCRQQEAAMFLLLQKVDMQSETAVELERGRAEARVQSLERDYARYPLLQEEYQEQKACFSQDLVLASTQLKDLLGACQRLEVTGLPSLPVIPDERESAFPYEQALRTMLNAIRSALQNALNAMDESGTRTALYAALGEQGQIDQQIKSSKDDVQQNQKAITTILTGRGLMHPSTYTSDSLIACWPLIAAVSPGEESQVTGELEQARKHLYAVDQQARALAGKLHQPGTPLDMDECQQKVNELREERQVCEWGAKFIQETKDRIARHVLPITERNMQPLLQQLTGGRYRDVRLTPEESNDQSSTMDYRIRVWDRAAGRFVAKNLFSGGTRDQCSLALRLAFALATLPQELGVAPGFIFLDEPLSAFDAQRAQALVELLTTGIIAQQFNQVVLISHSHAFDRDAFHYHVRMEGGQVIESDLPQEAPEREALPALATAALK